MAACAKIDATPRSLALFLPGRLDTNIHPLLCKARVLSSACAMPMALWGSCFYVVCLPRPFSRAPRCLPRRRARESSACAARQAGSARSIAGTHVRRGGCWATYGGEQLAIHRHKARVFFFFCSACRERARRERSASKAAGE